MPLAVPPDPGGEIAALPAQRPKPRTWATHGEVIKGLQVPETSKTVIYFRKLPPEPIPSARQNRFLRNGNAKWHIERHFANFKAEVEIT